MLLLKVDNSRGTVSNTVFVVMPPIQYKPHKDTITCNINLM